MILCPSQSKQNLEQLFITYSLLKYFMHICLNMFLKNLDINPLQTKSFTINRKLSWAELLTVQTFKSFICSWHEWFYMQARLKMPNLF